MKNLTFSFLNFLLTYFIPQMNHVAIMSKKPPWLLRIKQGRKTIESRWYYHKRAPWRAIQKGDTIYFKNTGEAVTVCAIVSSVLFYEHLTNQRVSEIISQYGDALGLLDDEKGSFIQKMEGKKLGILIFLEQVTEVEPFYVDKSGFGAMSAWMSVSNIDTIKISKN